MIRVLVAALCLLVASAAFGQDAGLLYKQGSEARREGKFAEAVDKLREAARMQPENADVQVELGLALTPLQTFDEAEKAFRAALKIAPDYMDARLGLARLAFFAKRYEAARADTKAVLAKRPDDKDARALLEQIERAMTAERRARKRAASARVKVAATPAMPVAEPPAPPPLRLWRFDADGNLSKLTGGREDWREFSARLAYQLRSETVVSGGIEIARRSGAADAYFEGRIDHKMTPDVSAYLLLGGTPEADFRPVVAVGGGIAARLYRQQGLFAATVLTAEAKHSEYVVGPVTNFAPGIEQHLLDGKVWVTAKWIHTNDERGRQLQGYLIRGDVMLRDDLRVFAGYADAPETSEGFTMETRTVFGGVSYDINPDITMRMSLAYEQRPDFFDRYTAGLGATLRF